MPRLPLLSGRQVVKVLAKTGWRRLKQRGSHIILHKSGADTTLSIPDHKELDRGVMRKLVRQAGLSVEDFLKLL